MAPALRRLVLVNAGRVEAIDAELPALKELWLLGQTEASATVLAMPIERVVVTDRSGELPAHVVEHRPTYGEDDEQPNAFVFIGGHVDRTILSKLVARMSGITTASARLGWLWLHRRAVTVLQMYGRADDPMLPFSLAVGLQHVLATAPPIALVKMLRDQAQYLVLGEQLARGTTNPTDANIVPIVRRAFDLAFGFDPGNSIVDDALDALAIAQQEDLVGTAIDIIFTMIDPDAPDLVDVDENAHGDDEDEDEDEDRDDDDQSELDAYEEPIPLAKVIVKTDTVIRIQADPDIEEADDPDAEVLELDLEEALERPDAWFEFRDNWERRASDPDDEPAEVRWPDPQVVERDAEDVELAVAIPACETHGTVYESCTLCHGPTCEACDKPRIVGFCPACVNEIDQPLPIEQPAHRGVVVD